LVVGCTGCSTDFNPLDRYLYIAMAVRMAPKSHWEALRSGKKRGHPSVSLKADASNDLALIFLGYLRYVRGTQPLAPSWGALGYCFISRTEVVLRINIWEQGGGTGAGGIIHLQSIPFI